MKNAEAGEGGQGGEARFTKIGKSLIKWRTTSGQFGEELVGANSWLET